METEQNKEIRNTDRGSSGAVPADLRHRNRVSVLSVFRRGGAYKVNDIAGITGISRQTVAKSVQHFIDNGLVADLGKGLSTDTGGKRPHLYRFSCSKMLLCVTAWPDMLNITLLDMNATKIDNEMIENDINEDPEKYFSEIGDRISNILTRNGINEENIFGIALSIPGTIDYTRNVLKYSSISPEWGQDIPVMEYLRSYVSEDCVIFVENAGKMTARSLLEEPGIERKRVLSLFTTWGISACLIDKGHILNGKDSLIGEIGHMTIDPADTEQCGCGGFGCLERQVSEDRIRQLINSRKSEFPGSQLLSLQADKITLADVFNATAEGDDLAKDIVSYMADSVATAIHNVSVVFDPDIVVFQGNFAKAGKWFDIKLRESLSVFRYYPSGGAFEIRYDDRPLDELDILGAANSLTEMFFSDTALY